ncbi:ubiquinone anaerobic biosynthesis accessory factor UbiT [Aliamphritea hakodatensis]|uniref:ubiquinone anaerobic biosynthesis accessory factor UbiT n=1 Tax=Aliamphritea hakodatensis TaxID=2895352 RepID=UPI0022FD6CA2|nr:SCP2 sterol-binding domain-containing protein [Aliamphritea hakodatensis]
MMLLTLQQHLTAAGAGLPKPTSWLRPGHFKPALRVVPFTVIKTGLQATLERLFAEALEDGDFECLTDQWLRIDITDLELSWLITYRDSRLVVADALREDAAAKVTFRASSEDLLLIAARYEDPDSLFFQRRLIIEGDTELGLEIKNIIDSADLDCLPGPVSRIVNFAAGQISPPA